MTMKINGFSLSIFMVHTINCPLRTLLPCPPKDLRVAFGVVVPKAMHHYDLANGNKGSIPIIFCLGDGQIPLALGTKNILGFHIL